MSDIRVLRASVGDIAVKSLFPSKSMGIVGPTISSTGNFAGIDGIGVRSCESRQV